MMKHYHFIGIGGIGMSALARILVERGVCVSGCDIAIGSSMCQELSARGVVIHQGHGREHIDGVTHLVYSTDIAQDLPELRESVVRGISVMHRSELLASLAVGRHLIGITGAHGKTTTTSMVAHLLSDAGLDPSYAIGGIAHNFGTNGHHGRGSYFVAEVDESDRSLLNIHPETALITNVDYEHPATYSSVDDVLATMDEFLRSNKQVQRVWLCADDDRLSSLAGLCSSVEYKTFGMSQHASVRAFDIEETERGSRCVVDDGENIFTIELSVPGRHNIVNALGAIGVARSLGVPPDVIQHSMRSFCGVARRFHHKGVWRGAQIFDDYAHHPTEIRCAVETARRRAKNRLVVIFQFHRYSRTGALWEEFRNLFEHFLSRHIIDFLILVPIYAAGEQPRDDITAERFANIMGEHGFSEIVMYADSHAMAKEVCSSLLHEGDVLITIGAGSVYRIGEEICRSEFMDASI